MTESSRAAGLRQMTLLATLASGALAAPASASIHTNIVEIFPSTNARPNGLHAMLRIHARGRNVVAGCSLMLFDASRTS